MQRGDSAVVVGLFVVALALAVTASIVGGATLPEIDDFEDNDTTIERPEWSGWIVNGGTFTTESSSPVINGSHSGEFIPGAGDAVRANRSSQTTQNLTFKTIYDGETGEQSSFTFDVLNGNSELLAIEYQEAASDGDPGNINVLGNTGTTTIDSFDESALNQQNYTVAFDFGADTAEVFLNGTSQGTFQLQASVAGYDGFRGQAIQAAVTLDDTHVYLDDVGTTQQAFAPSLNNSTASPTGTVSSASRSLEIDVNDSDFPTAGGDSVTVDFFMQSPGDTSRTHVGSDTLIGNGTASVPVTTSVGGDYEWNATATDAYGLTDSSQVFNFTVVSNLTIRNETSPYDPVSGCSANVRFYETTNDNPVITERVDSDNDGNVSLAGLPVGRQFAASVKCEGYNNRTILIDNLFEQNNAFLLHENRSESLITFEIDDRTGLYDTGELIVEKAIDESKYNASADGFEWITVAGDELNAADAFTAHLENGDRYRLTIRNDQGDTVILGPYEPTADDIVRLTVGQVGITAGEGNETVFNATIEDTSQLSNTPPVIQIQFVNPADITANPDKAVSNFNYSVFEAGNASNQIDSGTASGDLGTFYAETNITDNQTSEKWIIQVQYERGGETITQRRIVGGGAVDIQADDDWLGLFSLVLITSVGMLYGRRTANVGIVMVYLTAGVAMLLQVITISPAWYGVSGLLVAGALIRGELR